MRTIADAARGAGAILISDYGKGVITAPVIEAARAAAEREGAALIVDSKARSFARYGAADIIKPNAAELAYAVDLPTETDAEIEAALERALALCDCKAVLVTRSAKGMSLAVRGEAVRHFRRPPPEVFDTAGAGDTALAALGTSLSAGAPLAEAIDFALLAAGVVVQKSGTATASPDELIEAEIIERVAPVEAKIATPERMGREAERWRERGLTVGFTNGCFDILHRGHIAYLAQARGWCDRLIVGLNTDRSVTALKGQGRPVNDLESRALVLAGLRSVDLVVPFDEETPLALIEAARPDVLVKGADYSLEGVVGRQLVESWGGQVRLADLRRGPFHQRDHREARQAGMSRRIAFVTGGAGFIGSNVVARLCRDPGLDVVVCDWLGEAAAGKWRNLAKHPIADFTPPEEMFDWLGRNAGDVEVVIHMGAISSTTEPDADRIVKSNFVLSRDLWNWCAERGRRLIYASSAATYGDGALGFDDDNDLAALMALRPAQRLRLVEGAVRPPCGP